MTVVAVSAMGADMTFRNLAGSGAFEDAANWNASVSPTSSTWQASNNAFFGGNYGNLTLGCDMTLQRLVLNGKDVTLDLCGHALVFDMAGNSNADFLYCNTSNSKLRLKNGTVELVTSGKTMQWPDRGTVTGCRLEVSGSTMTFDVGNILIGGTRASASGSGDNNWIVVTNGAFMRTADLALPRYANGTDASPLGLSAAGNGLLVAGEGSRYVGDLIRFYHPACCNNRIIVTDGGSLEASQLWFRDGTNNSVTVTDGGRLSAGLRFTYDSGAAARSVGSSVTVSGEGAVFSNAVADGTLSLAAPGARFIVADGGSLANVTTFALSGEGSLLALRGAKTHVTLVSGNVSWGEPGSRVEISDGACLTLEDRPGTTGGRIGTSGEILVTGEGGRLEIKSNTSLPLGSRRVGYGNSVRIADGATFVCKKSILTGNFNGGGNLFRIDGGGKVECAASVIVGHSSGLPSANPPESWLSLTNRMEIAGAGSRLECPYFTVGGFDGSNNGSGTNSFGNILSVSAGGRIRCTSSTATSIIGSTCGANGLAVSSNAVLDLAGNLHVGRAAQVVVAGTTVAASVSTNNFLSLSDGASVACASFEVRGKDSSLAATNAFIHATGNVVLGNSTQGLSPVVVLAGTNMSVRADGTLTVGGGASILFSLPSEGICRPRLQSGGNMTFAADTAIRVVLDDAAGSADEYVLAEAEGVLSIPAAVIERATVEAAAASRYHLKMSNGRRLVFRKEKGTVVLFK